MVAYLVVHPVPKKLKKLVKKDSFVVAVDQALSDCVHAGVQVDFAIGDFDSLTDLSILSTVKHIKLDPEKDVTDTKFALDYIQKNNPEHTYILGGLGGFRFEHSLANLYLLNQYDNVTFITDQSIIKIYSVGTHLIDFKGYINIFTLQHANLSLKGFKYNLNHYNLEPLNSLGISNELLDKKGTLIVHEGKVLVILTKKV